jgi:hypothetical protein
MRKLIRLLFDPRGVVSRLIFAITALVLTAVKVSGDFILARIFLNHFWNVQDYLFLPPASLISASAVRSSGTCRFIQRVAAAARVDLSFGSCVPKEGGN